MTKNIDPYLMVLLYVTIIFMLCMIGVWTMDIWAPYAHCLSPEEIAELRRVADANFANMSLEK